MAAASKFTEVEGSKKLQFPTDSCKLLTEMTGAESLILPLQCPKTRFSAQILQVVLEKNCPTRKIFYDRLNLGPAPATMPLAPVL